MKADYTVTATMSELTATWAQYVDLIPEIVREEIATQVMGDMDEDITSAQLVKKVQYIIRQTLAGKIPPIMLRELTPWFDRLAAAVHQQHQLQGVKTSRQAMALALEGAMPPRLTIQPRYVLPEHLRPAEDIVEAKDPDEEG